MGGGRGASPGRALGAEPGPHGHVPHSPGRLGPHGAHGGPEEAPKAFTVMMARNEADEEEIASFEGLYAPWWKTVLFYLIALLSAGLSLLACKWSPRLYALLRLSPCALRDAQYVRIRLTDGRVDLERVAEVALAEPHADSQPTYEADEEAAPRGGLLDWQVQRVQRLLEYRCTRYFYVEGPEAAGGVAPALSGRGSSGTFVPVPPVPRGFVEQLQAAAQTLAATGQATAVEEAAEWDLGERQLRYGTNEMAIPVKSIFTLIFDEMWHPFYVFQYFSILIWIVGDAYYSYAVCIAAITWFSIVSAAVEAHRNMKRLADIAHFECDVDVIRGGCVQRLASSCLVPGDLVVVGPGTLPADMVLLRGEAILDENMLTGESVPVRKVPYSPTADGLAYQPDRCPGCTLFGGTLVAQARAARGQRAVAVVVRTRFYSAKGQLLRSILFPREHEESFISDSLRFIAVMLAACLGLYVWAAVVLATNGASPDRIVVRFFDMITIAVPPALPACLTIATVFSIGRLRRKGIYVTSPDRITLAGQLDVICFDKTGTLTEQGLDLQGIIPIQGGRTHNLVSAVSLLPTSLVELLASCHGLARMGESLVGDPLDQKLFLATHWDLIDERPDMDGRFGGAYGPPPGGEPGPGGSSSLGGAGSMGGAGAVDGVGGVDGLVGAGEGGALAPEQAAQEAAEATGTSGDVHTYVRPPGAVHAYSIIKRFEFSAALQRNLVVVKAPDGGVQVFAKGSPEALRTLVDPASVPPDFEALLGETTREGLRVLALAAGDAGGVPEAQLLGWTQAETEAGVRLQLVGLAVMANPLRGDTADTIAQLQYASIRTVMVTGDHLRTAVSVAHKCNILPTQRPILLIDAADAPVHTHAHALATPVAPAPVLIPGSPGPGPATPGGLAVPGPYGDAAAVPLASSPGAATPGHSAPLPVVRQQHVLSYTGATGPGPAGEPTPMGDPSIAALGDWAGNLLRDSIEEQEAAAAAAARAGAGGSPPGADGAFGGGNGDGGGFGSAMAGFHRGTSGHHAVFTLDGDGESEGGAGPGPGPAANGNGNGLHYAPPVLIPAASDAAASGASPAAAAAPLAPALVPPGSLPAGGLRLSVLDAEGNVLPSLAALELGPSGYAHSTTTLSTLSTASSSALPAFASAASFSAPANAQALLARVLTGDLECAVTGKGFSWLLAALDPGLLEPVLRRAGVFARMSPDNKRDLMLLLGSGIDGVEGCPRLGLRVGFCGDGANDCGALKAAHVGVSLCEAEASVAAPMTSKAQTIASMVTVVAEGRCTLMATYQIFQFIIAYALVQAFETNLMYTYLLNLGNYQYLIEDLFFTTVLAALMGFTEPRKQLSRSRPLQRVMSAPLLLSTLAQCVVVVVFQLAGLWLLQAQAGYVRFMGDKELHATVAPENSATYMVALAQFVVLALVFNKGMPHRSPLWTNGWLVAVLVLQTAFVLQTLFSDNLFNTQVQQLVGKEDFGGVMGTAFRWKLFGLLVLMGLTAYAFEYASIGLVRLVAWARGRGGGGGRGSVPATVVGSVRPGRK
ncbi:hypothetical protein HYH03_001317 [Edaphochlamys debaryana]|uniref:Cation-transporting ATPase n=1 Tax=Edaphochlamys debaryana TaxID=47281 RepID=A0A835YGJ4_9CHLO|nr:hypothetical protein HYH03_001317 [Edaphochlamys debaryana]|eukprot:KAG2500541.1 hypothetical protein HYH03_001317 [Edaphochlamys debaryana]